MGLDRQSVVSTKRAAQSYTRLSTPCFRGTKIRPCVMTFSRTSRMERPPRLWILPFEGADGSHAVGPLQELLAPDQVLLSNAS